MTHALTTARVSASTYHCTSFLRRPRQAQTTHLPWSHRRASLSATCAWPFWGRCLLTSQSANCLPIIVTINQKRIPTWPLQASVPPLAACRSSRTTDPFCPQASIANRHCPRLTHVISFLPNKISRDKWWQRGPTCNTQRPQPQNTHPPKPFSWPLVS